MNKSVNVCNDAITPLGMDEKQVAEDLDRHISLTLGRDEGGESHRYMFHALALTIRDRLIERWRATRDRYMAEQPRRINYLSLEFLMGRTLGNAVINLDLEEPVRQALNNYACTLEEVAQIWAPNRSFDLLDLSADMAGLAVFYGVDRWRQRRG